MTDTEKLKAIQDAYILWSNAPVPSGERNDAFEEMIANIKESISG